MKSILTILLVITSHLMVLAQNKNNIYIDVGINERGISATYDRKLTRHFDIGAGLSAYNFNYVSYGNRRSACYLDLRPYWGIRRSLLFVLADVGLAINGGRQPDSATLSPYGVYIAVGFGYCYRINKRGMGPYLSIGLYGSTENVHYKTPPSPPKREDYNVFDASSAISIGFKF